MTIAAQRPEPAGALVTIAGLLLTMSVVLGGGGTPAPVAEATVELMSLVALAVAVVFGLHPVDALRRDRVLAVLIGTILLFPLVQLVPLPPAWWQALPGREAATGASTATGGAGWRPWSLLPDGGVAAALALLPAMVVLLLQAAMPVRLRVWLVAIVAVLAFAAAMLGLVQFMRGPERVATLYDTVHRGWAIGFFANRNAQADLVAVGLVAGMLLVERHRARLSGTTLAGLGVTGLLMLAGGVATGSRMGMVVLAVPVVLALAQAGRRAPWLGAALAVGVALMLVGGTALDRVTARAQDPGARAEIWGDSLFVARSVAPLGAGMGSFPPLYAAAERLDHVQPTVANRAHNDYLELAIEGGVPALALLAATLLFAGRRAVAGWRDADPDRRLLARFAGLVALIFALHATVDYPLRNIALLAVAGLALGGLASMRRPPQGPDEHRLRARAYA